MQNLKAALEAGITAFLEAYNSPGTIHDSTPTITICPAGSPHYVVPVPVSKLPSATANTLLDGLPVASEPPKPAPVASEPTKPAPAPLEAPSDPAKAPQKPAPAPVADEWISPGVRRLQPRVAVGKAKK